MKKLREKKAFTIIEVLLAIVILCLVAFPLFSVFTQSIRIDRKATNVLNANYISQGYLEKLDAMTYSEALANLPDRSAVDNYYLTAKIIPYGTVNSKFADKCSYAQLIMYNDNSMLAVMPDGKWYMYSSVPDSASFNVANGTYSFTAGYTSLTGSSEYDYCAIIINTMHKPTDTKMSINLGTSSKAFVYCNILQTDNISFSGGSHETYEGMMEGNTSLVYVITEVYDSASGTDAAAISESYISIKNW